MKKKQLFLIIGAPGSGKTTNAEIIAQNNPNISHYSTGDMLRAEVANKSELGQEIHQYISKGLIVPIEIAIKTITNAIKNSPNDIILLDGYPRSIEQMEALENFLQQDESIILQNVIEIKVSEQTAKERVLGRARGDDDNISVFNNRMKVYLEPLPQIKQFYETKNIFTTISGEGTIQENVQNLEEFLKTQI